MVLNPHKSLSSVFCLLQVSCYPIMRSEIQCPPGPDELLLHVLLELWLLYCCSRGKHIPAKSSWEVGNPTLPSNSYVVLSGRKARLSSNSSRSASFHSIPFRVLEVLFFRRQCRVNWGVLNVCPSLQSL